MLKVNIFGESYEVSLSVAQYSNNGATAVQLMSDEGPFSTISVNLPESGLLSKGQFFGKHWSENEGILEQLVAQGAIKKVAGISPVASGFINGIEAYEVVA
jgi:hypothetical protein